MPNRLVDSLSPYLAQHADNPVNWFPWGEEAFAKAGKEDKPIFLSIGYAACHWCHVMEHESFTNDRIAAILNDHFVSIKVDREERPDVDAVYMEAVQAMTGSGGWPMSVFLTPDRKPFYGGTYFPPQRRGPMPGFEELLLAVHDAWKNRRADAEQQARSLTAVLQADNVAATAGTAGLSDLKSLVDSAAESLARSFDSVWGGFGGAPKFPRPSDFGLLLRHWHRTGSRRSLEMVTTSLNHMADGGIYDHVGGGFHRYSTDRQWLVPHFEKMLYDNAQLARAYVETWQVTAEDRYRRVAEETLGYVLRDMRHPDGGFFSSEDADSEGEEGLFYTWTPDELVAVLGREQGDTFAQAYGITEQGNFEGRSIAHLHRPLAATAEELGRDLAEVVQELEENRTRLLATREKRIRPLRDEKVLVGWNGLMIDTLAFAGASLQREQYMEAAIAAAEYVERLLRDGEGRLLHCRRDRRASHPAYLEDHAALACGLVSLYEATFDERWIDRAIVEADCLVAEFFDSDRGGFFSTSHRHEALIARKRDLLDNAIPSGSSLAATALLKLGSLCGRGDYLAAAEETIEATAAVMQRAPQAASHMLIALDFLLGPSPEIVLLEGAGSQPSLVQACGVHRRFLGNRVLAYRCLSEPPDYRSDNLEDLFRGKTLQNGEAQMFVCRGGVCREPIAGQHAIDQAVFDMAHRKSLILSAPGAAR
ncbi:MAG: thioredoxin domain-containing protein [Planctomycetaceae bacterium]|nr:thioredoxin domain-containing protein [Planctomycetaceae bacterium]